MIKLDIFTKDVMDELAQFIYFAMTDEIVKTDLVYTKGLLNSIETVTKRMGLDHVLDILADEHGIVIDRGFTAEDAKEENKIGGAFSYWKRIFAWLVIKKGVEQKKAKGFAWVIYKKHMKEGYDSKRSGVDGNRGFIDYVSSDIRGMSKALEDDFLFATEIYRQAKKYEDENLIISIKL